ncbi:hypothetical protein ACLOJK_011697 [Asimina triloba]
MFYSQFILAKKGPLGTIWIAAHLERKLRKNQVADTDIGVSVGAGTRNLGTAVKLLVEQRDSILFPEVPIALRLSSHLLLGVVRIYSRKVNYLFHDCSEALLNIKQAFRSTAVDLPPEESTAPYHSITLPETFDLDDFELPENALFQGNFVDHHVSTREQITLQDTIDGMSFSTSQFGPDERFGDGDASQIGLDLDEDLFMDKFPSTEGASVPLDSKESVRLLFDPTQQCEGYPPGSVSGYPLYGIYPTTIGDIKTSSTLMDVDGIESARDLSEPFDSACRSHIDSHIQYSMGIDDSPYPHGDRIQTPDLNEELLACEPIGGPSVDTDRTDFPRNVAHVVSSDCVDCAHAPSTPGLMEGAIVAGVHEVPTLNLLRKNSLHDSEEGLTPEANDSTHLEPLDFNPTEPMPDEPLGSPVDDLDSHAEDANRMASVLNSTSLDVRPTQNIEYEPTSKDALQDNPAELPMPDEPLGSPVDDLDSHAEDADHMASVLNSTSLDVRPTQNIEYEPTSKDALQDNPTELPMPDEPLGSPVDDLDSHAEDANHMASVLNSTSLDVRPTQNIEYEPTSKDALQDNPAELLVNGHASVHVNENLLEPVGEMNSPNSALLFNTGSQIKSVDMGDTEKVDCEACSMPENFEHDDHTDTSEDPCAHTHVLQACSLSANQPNALPMEDVALVENISKLSLKEVGSSTLETEGKVVSDTRVASDEMRGEGAHGAVISSNIETEAGMLLLENEAGCNKLDVGLHNVSSKDTQIEASKGSDFPAPETLLSAPEGVSDLPNDLLVQTTLDKEAVTEGDGTVDRFQSLSGRKHNLRESTLQNSTSAMLSGTSRSKRSMDYIPEDDDVLASILVGRRTPSLKLKSTPELVSSKRLRMTPKTSISKRKALMDDTMVLSGEITRPQGTSAGLTGLEKQMYHKTRTGLSLADSNNSVVGAKQLELSGRTDLGKETSLGVMDELTAMPEKNVTESKGHAETISQIENQCETAIYSLRCDSEEQMLDVPLPDSSGKGQSEEPVAMEIDLLETGEDNESLSADKNNKIEVVLENETSYLSPGHESVLLADGKPVEGCDEMSHLAEDLYTEKDASTKETTDIAADLVNQNLNQVENASITTDASTADVNVVISIEAAQPCLSQELHIGGGILGNYLLETGMGILIDSMNPVGNSAPFPDPIVEISEPDDIHNGHGGIRSSEWENGAVDELVTLKATNGENHSSDVICEDGSQLASECPLQLDGERENIPVEGQEHLDFQGINHKTPDDTKMPPAEYCDDFDHVLDENDTDDDEEPVDEENDNMPSAEEGRFVENSGWSSRTRAVARYLQSLLDREAGRGRKYVAMDNLLVGKTRKEASRMFFETLD